MMMSRVWQQCDGHVDSQSGSSGFETWPRSQISWYFGAFP